MLYIVIGLAVIVISLLKLFKTQNVWIKKQIPHVKPWPIFGNMTAVAFRRKSFAQRIQELYNQFPNERYYGMNLFTTPTLAIRDPDLIKEIFIKESNIFSDHHKFMPENADAFWSRNLFAMSGKKWHTMRCILTPLFTGNKLRSMFLFMVECSQTYLDYCKSLSKEGVIEIDIKDVFLRFTNDVIASTAFGVQLNSAINKDNEFYRLGKNSFELDGLKGLKFFGHSISPRLMQILRVQFFDSDFQNFFRKLVNDTIDYREQTGYIRPDMIHFLHEAQKGQNLADNNEDTLDVGFAVTSESNKPKLNEQPIITNEDIAAQASVFFFGGFDSVGIVLAHMAYELAVNPDVQAKLIQEVDQTFEECNRKLTYEALVKMKYMDMVTSETLRLWTPGIFIARISNKEYTIQANNSLEKPLILEKGSEIVVPVHALHRDPNYYPNPEKFDPERFSAEHKQKIRAGTYMPFGTGPRNCIASRFAITECKVLFFFLLTQFEFVPVEKTPIPFRLSKKHIQINSENGYWLGLKHRKSGKI